MLTKYGIDNIIIMLSIGLILMCLGLCLIKGVTGYIISGCGLLLILFTLLFFRDPDRIISQEAINDNSIILSPADGKVLEVVEEMENVYLKTKAYRISIFLSAFNVHVNRIPMTGKIQYFKYHPGEYLIAYYEKSSSKNEQSHIGMENQYGKIFFKQIVGIVARRLVWDIKVGDSVQVGQKFGMMKFGSRMDVVIPVGNQILIKPGDKVVGGETILAKLKH